MHTVAHERPASQTSRRLHYGLWAAQVLLAVAFAGAGFMKLTITPADLAKAMPAGGAIPMALIRFIGFAEVAGAIGLILPSATRVLPVLTPVAAGGLALIMALAAALHTSRAEFMSLPVVFGLGALAIFVLWGRTTRAPIPPRG
jgi:putative oxidoreductase